jgi:hypothetical protein
MRDNVREGQSRKSDSNPSGNVELAVYRTSTFRNITLLDPYPGNIHVRNDYEHHWLELPSSVARAARGAARNDPGTCSECSVHGRYIQWRT